MALRDESDRAGKVLDRRMARMPDEGRITDVDERAVRAFRRFLTVAGPVGARLRGARGWLPYALGLGPEPPPELDDTPLTAMRMPG